jgi:hypothetical protein
VLMLLGWRAQDEGRALARAHQGAAATAAAAERTGPP